MLDSEPTKEFVFRIALEDGEPDDISTDLTEIVFDNGLIMATGTWLVRSWSYRLGSTSWSK